MIRAEVFFWNGNEWDFGGGSFESVEAAERFAIDMSYHYPVKLADRGTLLGFYFRGEKFVKEINPVSELPPDTLGTVIAKFLKGIPLDSVFVMVEHGLNLKEIVREHILNIAAESNYTLYPNEFFSDEFITLGGGRDSFHESELNAPEDEFDDDEEPYGTLGWKDDDADD